MGSSRKANEAEGAPRLLEREQELDVITSAVERARGGTGALLVLEGPAGIGKTSLVSHARAIAETAGFLVRSARCDEMEREIPFGVVRQLFEPLLARASEEQRRLWLSGSASHALAALGRADVHGRGGEGDAFAMINGLYWLVANLALSRPVLLTIDDAQWADTYSLRFAGFLARRLADLPAAVVVAVRTGEPGEPFELAPLRLDSTRLEPAPLGRASIDELIAEQLGEALAPDLSDACAAASAGNPFLLLEMLRELRAEGRESHRDAAASVAALAPENVVRTVQLRLARFGRDAIAVAHAVAVLGRSPQLRHAAQLAGLDEATTRAVIDRLRAAEILAPGTPIDFVHPVVRQAVYRSQPEEERSAAHRRAAEILWSTGATAEEVATQLMVCAPNGDPWVVSRLEEAMGEAAEEWAYESAVPYIERALREGAGDELTLLYHLGVALMDADIARAPGLLSSVAERTRDPQLKADILRRLTTAHAQTGNVVAAMAAAEEAADTVGHSNREVALALEAERYLLIAPTRGRDPSTSERIERVAASLPGATSGERVARQALAVDRWVDSAPIAEVVRLALPFPADAAWEIEGFPSPAPVFATKILAWSGRWHEARRPLAAWTEYAHRLGRPRSVSFGNASLSEVDRLSGRLREAEAEAMTAWEIVRAHGGASLYTWVAHMSLGASHLARGDTDAFVRLTAHIDLSAGPPSIPINPWPVELRALLRLEQGDLEAAVEDLLTLGGGLEQLGIGNPAYPSWRQDATEALAALGRVAEAEELIGVAEERAETFGVPHVTATVLRARAHLQPRAQAIQTLQRSAELLEPGGPPHELARSLIALGAGLRRAGDRSDARHALHRALELAHACGAGGLERRAREELAAAGARPRRPATTGVAALTASELKTAQLAAGGLTNKEIAERLFVTLRTVETHLTHVYEKLGVSGRRALRAAFSDD